jgi:hypothetical protein
MAIFSFPTQVNERAARLVGGIVCALAVTALVTRWTPLLPILAAGFLLRVAWGPKVDPIGRLAVTLAPKVWAVVPVAGAPKRFAQGIGAVVTLAASVLAYADLHTPAWVLVGVLSVFAALEAGLGFCFGCWAYRQLQAAGVLPPDACVDCRPSAT